MLGACQIVLLRLTKECKDCNHFERALKVPAIRSGDDVHDLKKRGAAIVTAVASKLSKNTSNNFLQHASI